MLAETRAWKDAGVEGVVTGALLADGRLDAQFLAEFMEASQGMKRTLHRAFDLCADPFAALEEAVALGFNTILTSGQKANCRAGAELIGELREDRDKILRNEDEIRYLDLPQPDELRKIMV